MIESIEYIVRITGKAVSWLCLVLVVLMTIDVSFRYLFSITSVASFETEWHLFALIFLLSAGWAYQKDRHVRVDVFYQQFSDKTKAWVNLVGNVILLIPMCVVIILQGIVFSDNAFSLSETSPDPGGLPYRFLIKAAIPMGFLFLLLQAIAMLLRSVKIILK